jgi:hypothetical protein
MLAGELRPSNAVYYDDLDTVRFGGDVSDEVRKARDVTAMGTVMLSIIAANVPPILSRAQSYDNQLLLTLVSPEGDSADRLAFLALARTGFIQVGLMRNGAQAALGSDPYTLTSAFRIALLDDDFLLSGWPELDRQPDLRREIARCIDERGGYLTDAVPTAVSARLEGLREFDRNLAQSPNGIAQVDHAGGEKLGERVGGLLAGISDAVVHDATSGILGRGGRGGMNMDSRSAWYRLIERQSAGRPAAELAALDVVRDLVDVAYNGMVGESLGRGGMSLSTGAEAAIAAAGELTPGISPGRRWADLSPAPGRGDWMRWRDVPDLLASLQVLAGPDQRVEELKRRQSQWIAEYETTHSWGISVRIALPLAVGNAVTGLAGALITSATPGHAAGTAALTGVATLVAGTPAVRAMRVRQEARLRQRLITRDDRSAIRTGAAGWPERRSAR